MIIQAVLKYKEELKKLETVKFTLKFKDLQPPKKLPETWHSDPKYSSGCLSIYLLSPAKILLLQKYVRYGELIDPTSPAEWQYTQELKLPKFNTVEKIKSKNILLTFEPSMVRSKKLYENDDIHDWFEDAPENKDQQKHVIIYTESSKEMYDEFFSTLPEPNMVLTVQTNHKPYHEEDMPVVFTLPQEISLEVNNETAFNIHTDKIKCNHEYVLSARWKPGLEKELIYYSISTEITNGS